MDPMQIDHIGATSGEEFGLNLHEDGDQEDYLLGEGRSRRPVLRGNAINFHNIDGPQSLMTAWKKLVSTSANFCRESNEHLRG